MLWTKVFAANTNISVILVLQTKFSGRYFNRLTDAIALDILFNK